MASGRTGLATGGMGYSPSQVESGHRHCQALSSIGCIALVWMCLWGTHFGVDITGPVILPGSKSPPRCYRETTPFSGPDTPQKQSN